MKTAIIGLLITLSSAQASELTSISFQEVPHSELSIEEQQEITSNENPDCPNCPRLVLLPNVGLAYGQMKNVQSTSVAPLRTVHLPLLDFSADAMISFNSFQIGASVRVPLVMIIPAYESAGLVIEKSIRSKRLKGLYIQGRYYRALQGSFFQTYDVTTGNRHALQKNLIGVEVGLRRSNGESYDLELGKGTQNLSVFFLRSLDGEWTNFGIKMNVQYFEKALRRQGNVK